MFDSPPLLVILSDPGWQQHITRHIPAQTATVRHYCPDSPKHLIEFMIDHFPALAIMDGTDPQCATWIKALRMEQATRRVPLVVVDTDAAQSPALLAAGADAFLLLSELAERLHSAIQTHARRLTSAEIEQLRCQCAEELPPLAQLGVRRFNAGAYYAQHDAFEELWMDETGPVRELYRVVLQVGVAYYHISRGNYAGGLKMLRRTAQWFVLLPDECQGINVRQLRTDANRVRRLLRDMNPADIGTFDRSLFKCVPLLDEGHN